jgi:cyanophycin synthetase
LAIMAIIEQRFLRGPNLWSSKSCLLAVLDLGALRQALSCDAPGFADALLALLPGLRPHAGALRRGCYLAEVIAMAMLELQRQAGAPPPSGFVTIMMGRSAQCRLIVASASQPAAGAALAAALALVVNLYTARSRRTAAPIRLPQASVMPARARPAVSRPARCAHAAPAPGP